MGEYQGLQKIKEGKFQSRMQITCTLWLISSYLDIGEPKKRAPESNNEVIDSVKTNNIKQLVIKSSPERCRQIKLLFLYSLSF